MIGPTAIPSIVRAAANLRCQSAILDGEAIVQNGNGASDFEALSSAFAATTQQHHPLCV
jgi:ATP-dependent DNA ligase